MKHVAKESTLQLASMAQQYYLAEGYHNNEHRQDVIDRALKIGSIAVQSGLEPDFEVLVLASSWHDAGIGLNPKDVLIYANDIPLEKANHSEGLSANLFESEATKLNLSLDKINHVREVIIGTNPNEPLLSLESQIVAAADLYGVGFDTNIDFIDNTHKLWQEECWRNHKETSWEEFVMKSIKYLSMFMARKIEITSKYYDEYGKSAWHVGAIKNTLHLVDQILPDKEVHVSIFEAVGESSADLHILSREFKSTIKIPLHIENDTISCPKEIVDELTIDRSSVVNKPELRSVIDILKSDGILMVA